VFSSFLFPSYTHYCCPSRAADRAAADAGDAVPYARALPAEDLPRIRLRGLQGHHSGIPHPPSHGKGEGREGVPVIALYFVLFIFVSMCWLLLLSSFLELYQFLTQLYLKLFELTYRRSAKRSAECATGRLPCSRTTKPILKSSRSLLLACLRPFACLSHLLIHVPVPVLPAPMTTVPVNLFLAFHAPQIPPL
jgi:hypothetical protein